MTAVAESNCLDTQTLSKSQNVNTLEMIEQILSEFESYGLPYTQCWVALLKLNKLSYSPEECNLPVILESVATIKNCLDTIRLSSFSPNQILKETFQYSIPAHSRIFKSKLAVETVFFDYKNLHNRFYMILDDSMITEVCDALYLKYRNKAIYGDFPISKQSEDGESMPARFYYELKPVGDLPTWRGLNGYLMVEYLIYSLLVTHYQLGSKAVQLAAQSVASIAAVWLNENKRYNEVKHILPDDKLMLKIIKLGSQHLYDLKLANPTSTAIHLRNKPKEWFTENLTYKPDNVVQTIEFKSKTESHDKVKELLESQVNFTAYDTKGKEAKFFLHSGALAIVTRGRSGEYYMSSERLVRKVDVLRPFTDEERLNIKLRNSISTTAKYFVQSHKSSFSNSFIDVCRYPDPYLGCYENGLSSGTRIDGQCISLDTVKAKAGYEGQSIANSFQDKSKYTTSRFPFNGYEGSCSAEFNLFGDWICYFNKEYVNCGNGYYYIAINDKYFIGVDID